MKLHHYTTPAAFERIATSGLEPNSTYPGRDAPVTYAFLTEATNWGPHEKIDDVWSMNVLKRIIWSIGWGERAGPEGLVHLTFEAPTDTNIHNRAALRESHEAYHATGVPPEDRRTWSMYDHPEAAITTAIPPENITIAEALESEAVRALLTTYSQHIPRQPFKTRRM